MYNLNKITQDGFKYIPTQNSMTVQRNSKDRIQCLKYYIHDTMYALS